MTTDPLILIYFFIWRYYFEISNIFSYELSRVQIIQLQSLKDYLFNQLQNVICISLSLAFLWLSCLYNSHSYRVSFTFPLTFASQFILLLSYASQFYLASQFALLLSVSLLSFASLICFASKQNKEKQSMSRV